MAAAVITVEESGFGSVFKIKWTFTSATDGTASLVTVGSYYGTVMCLVTDPGATAPTDNYDITVTDADSFDVLQGVGANRDTSTTETVNPPSVSPAFGKLTINITNAGDTKDGVATLYVLGDRKGL